MPERLKRKLAARASALALHGDEWRAYVYGALRRMGWKPGKGHKARRRVENAKSRQRDLRNPRRSRNSA